MFLSSSAPASEEGKLFNVTAIGGGNGISVLANESASVTLSASNTIASGGEHDVYADAFATTASVRADLSHSNFVDVLVEGVDAEVSSPTTAGNQTAPPLFADAAGGDYREATASPTRGAGDTAVVLPGETDLDGTARIGTCGGIAASISAPIKSSAPPPTPPSSLESSGAASTATPPVADAPLVLAPAVWSRS